MVDSPLAPIAFQSNESGQSGTVPLYRLYYQSAFGNAKEMIKDGGSSQWQTAQYFLRNKLLTTSLLTRIQSYSDRSS